MVRTAAIKLLNAVRGFVVRSAMLAPVCQDREDHPVRDVLQFPAAADPCGQGPPELPL